MVHEAGTMGYCLWQSEEAVPADSKAPTAAETEGIEAWDDKAEKAAGESFTYSSLKSRRSILQASLMISA